MVRMIPPALRTFAQLAQQIADDCEYILREIKEICGLAHSEVEVYESLVPDPREAHLADGLAGAVVAKGHIAATGDREAREGVEPSGYTAAAQLPPAPASPPDVTSEPTVPQGWSAERLHVDTFKQLELA